MLVKDSIHATVNEAVIKDGWEITNDPYVISCGERFLFVDLGASGFIGVRQRNKQIAIEIKQFRSQSQVADLEQAIVHIHYIASYLIKSIRNVTFILLFLTQSTATYESEPIGKLMIAQLPLKLIVVN